MKTYLFTLIHGSTRTVRKIIASSAMHATQIGMRLLPDTDEPLAIICKPAEAICPSI